MVPEDIDGYIEVKNKIKTPVAGGENEHTLFGFRDLIKKRAVDIAQPYYFFILQRLHMHMRLLTTL